MRDDKVNCQGNSSLKSVKMRNGCAAPSFKDDKSRFRDPSIDKSQQHIALSQSHYILTCLDRFGMSDCNGVDLPLRERLSNSSQPSSPIASYCEVYRAMVGSLLYVAQWTRPDISFSVSELSRFVSNPGKEHVEQAKRVFRYLKQTLSLHLEFSSATVPGSPVTDNQLWG